MTQDLEKTLWAAADKLRNNMDKLFNYQPLIDALLEKGYHEDQIPMTINRILHDIITAYPNSSLHPIAEAWGLSFDLLVDYLKYRARI